MYLKTITGESHTPLHFRDKFLPVPLVRKVLFCTNRILCTFETLPDRKILYTYLNSAQKVLLSSPIEVLGPKKKKLNFVAQCNLDVVSNNFIIHTGHKHIAGANILENVIYL